MIVVTSYGERFELAPIEGRTILSLVNDSVKIPELDGIPFQCQAGTCKRCVVYVEDGQEFLEAPNDIEKRALGPRLQRGFRLACQMKARNQKKYLRTHIVAKRLALTDSQRTEFDQAITNSCLELESIQKAKVVMAYLDFKGEVATRSLIEAFWKDGKSVLVPVVDKAKQRIVPVPFSSYADIRVSTFGLPEPPIVLDQSTEDNIRRFMSEIEAVIVPGVAFRTDGGRLGYGGGYYDRFLPHLKKTVVKIGLAYPLQINETFPVEDHDIPLDFVITPKKVYKAKR
jgi:5-formyltetrahydrofolate cyclo-ligase